MDVFPQNIYRHWSKAVSDAVRGILVLTPYFDNTLVGLLQKHLNKPIKLRLLTDIDTPDWSNMTFQLSALIVLCEIESIEIRSLAGLHAKAILVDDEVLITGSQNFTIRGKKNFEITTKHIPVKKSVCNKLEAWWEKGRGITIDEVILLKEALKDDLNRLSNLQRDIGNKRDKILKEREAERKRKRDLLLAKKAANSTFRVASQYTYLSAKPDGLFSLDDDLTIYKKNNNQLVELKRLGCNLMYFTDTKKLLYGRIAKSRIRYYTTSVKLSAPWSKDPVEVEIQNNQQKNLPPTIKCTTSYGKISIIFDDGDLKFIPLKDGSLFNAKIFKKSFQRDLVDVVLFNGHLTNMIRHENSFYYSEESFYQNDGTYQMTVIDVGSHPVLFLTLIQHDC